MTRFSNLSAEDKISFINGLSIEAFNQFRYYSNDFLRPNQIVPPGDWSYFIAQCGRGWGKSLLGAHWIASKVYQGISGLALVAPTHADIEDYIKEAIEAEFPPHLKPRYIAGDKKHFICFNGIKIKAYSSDKEIRGSNLKYIWLDEFCAWNERIEEKATNSFTHLNRAVRKGDAQMVITTTPRPWAILRKWNDRFKSGDPAIHMVFGEMSENYGLSERKKLEFYEEASNSRDKRQELFGELLEDIEGALFTYDMIDKNRYIGEELEFDKTIISVDPAVTATDRSDITGIIVLGLHQGQVYVIADLSGKYTPKQWADKVNQAYKQYQASYVVAETNQGGDLVKANIHSINPYILVKDVRATKGKLLRAEPVANLYQQGKIHHIGTFSELERQMTTYTGDGKSPDRLDALVYGVTDIGVRPNVGSELDTRYLPYF